MPERWLNPARVIAVLLLILPGPALPDGGVPYLFVLGVAQDAGYPQAGCYRAHCLPGWQDRDLRRTAVSLGLIDPQTRRKYMFEATPDLPEQLYELEKEAPTGQYRLAGIFLSHAHMGHYTGLMFLGHESMAASEVPVFAMPRMHKYLATNGPWSQLISYRNITVIPLQNEIPQTLGSVKVIPFRVPHREEYSEAVGYRIVGPNRSALFIPDIDKWSKWDRDITGLITTVDYALLDATFFAGDELPTRDMSTVQHPFVTETMALLEQLPRAERRKVWFIHMNHSNPMLDPASKASEQVRSKGYNIAVEGARLYL